MKVLKDKGGKWYFVSRPILLPWAHGEILVLLCKSEVFLSSAEKWYPALEVAVSEVSGCALSRNFWEWPWPRRNLHLPCTEGDHPRHKSRPRKGSERASIPMGLFSDVGDLMWSPDCLLWQFSNQSFLPLIQHTCLRVRLGNAIRDVSGFNKWEVLPRHPSDGESSVEPGRMTDAGAYQGHEWQLAPLCPTFRRGSPNTTAVQDSLPDSSHTREVP